MMIMLLVLEYNMNKVLKVQNPNLEVNAMHVGFLRKLLFIRALIFFMELCLQYLY